MSKNGGYPSKHVRLRKMFHKEKYLLLLLLLLLLFIFILGYVIIILAAVTYNQVQPLRINYLAS